LSCVEFIKEFGPQLHSFLNSTEDESERQPALLQRKSLIYPFNRKIFEPHIRSGWCREETNILLVTGIKTLPA